MSVTLMMVTAPRNWLHSEASVFNRLHLRSAGIFGLHITVYYTLQTGTHASASA